jgi:hypothetical protein
LNIVGSYFAERKLLAYAGTAICHIRSVLAVRVSKHDYLGEFPSNCDRGESPVRLQDFSYEVILADLVLRKCLWIALCLDVGSTRSCLLRRIDVRYSFDCAVKRRLVGLR